MALTHRLRPALVAADGDRDDEPDVQAVVGVEQPAALSVRVVGVVALVAGLWWGKVVLIPIVLSVLISYALEPLVARLHSWRVPRALGVPLVLTILLASGAAVTYVLRGEAAAFIERIPSGVHVVATAIQRAARGTPGTVTRVQQAADELRTPRTRQPARGATA